MTADLLKPPSAELRQLTANAAHYATSTLADSTLVSYRKCWAHWQTWCADMGIESLPAEPASVAVYFAALADGNVEVRWTNFRTKEPKSRKAVYKYGTIQHIYAAILWGHRTQGHDFPSAHPAITKVLHGIKYRKGDKKARMTPLLVADLRTILSSDKMRERRFEDLTIIRDRALLSLGFFSAMRRGELVALRVEDLAFGPDGLTVTVRKSKTDQFAQGAPVYIVPQADPLICPIVLLKRYLEVSGLKSGPLFRRIDSRSDCMGDRQLTDQVVALIVKACVEAVGLDPTLFAGHSLRAGFITEAAQRGVSMNNIMRHSRHTSERVAATYIRPATGFIGNATRGLSDPKEEK
jgi:integrase